MRAGGVWVRAPFGYSAGRFARLLGYAVWDEGPSGWAWLGIGLLVGSGLYMLHSERGRLRAAAVAGLAYKSQPWFDSLLGGREVVVVMERDGDHPTKGDTYRLLATAKTSTMEKELREVGGAGFEALGMTVSKTLLGGKELVTITRRRGTR